MAQNIKVAVRVRPFTNKERQAGAELAVAMDGASTVVKTAQMKTFTYDYSYWSHDEASPNYKSQKEVMDEFAGAVLRNGMEGFNGCLFAYGQTGSGKTYSVFGTKHDPGVIPYTIGELLEERVRLRAAPDRELRVWISFLEIYNERILDLLAPRENKRDLIVVDNPQVGVYIPGITEHPCQSLEEVNRLMDFGTKQRAVAATEMNASSSRSHAVFCVRAQQFFGKPPKPGAQDDRQVLTAKINLVDLAGSERQSKSGTRDATFREGCNINRSLSALGMVIKELSTINARNSRKKSKNSLPTDRDACSEPEMKDLASYAKLRTEPAEPLPVTFRATKLTFLLKDSLAGNSKTYMLAAISPSSTCVEETLSTLRFASSVKAIKTVAWQNRDKKDELIESLRQELETLRARNRTQELTEQERLIEDLKMSYENEISLAEQLEHARQDVLRDMSLSHEGISTVFGMGGDTPYLLNMADDPTLAGCLLYYLPQGKQVSIGSAKDNTISFTGIGICENLCVIENLLDGHLRIWKSGPGGRLLLDGRPLHEADGSKPLHHGQHLLLGRAHAMRVCIPSESRIVSETSLVFEDQLLADEEDSPSWCDLQGALEQVVSRLAPERARTLVDDVRLVVKACDEANDITAQCRGDEGWHFKADVTSDAPVVALVRVLRKSHDSDEMEPMYVWSLREMEDRLERMREYFYDAMHRGTIGAGYDLHDPWKEVPFADVLELINQLRSRLEDTVDENCHLKFQKKQSTGRALLLWEGSQSSQVLALVFRAWSEMSAATRRAFGGLCCPGAAKDTRWVRVASSDRLAQPASQPPAPSADGGVTSGPGASSELPRSLAKGGPEETPTRTLPAAMACGTDASDVSSTSAPAGQSLLLAPANAGPFVDSGTDPEWTARPRPRSGSDVPHPVVSSGAVVPAAAVRAQSAPPRLRPRPVPLSSVLSATQAATAGVAATIAAEASAEAKAASGSRVKPLSPPPSGGGGLRSCPGTPLGSSRISLAASSPFVTHGAGTSKEALASPARRVSISFPVRLRSPERVHRLVAVTVSPPRARSGSCALAPRSSSCAPMPFACAPRVHGSRDVTPPARRRAASADERGSIVVTPCRMLAAKPHTVFTPPSPTLGAMPPAIASSVALTQPAATVHVANAPGSTATTPSVSPKRRGRSGAAAPTLAAATALKRTYVSYASRIAAAAQVPAPSSPVASAENGACGLVRVPPRASTDADSAVVAQAPAMRRTVRRQMAPVHSQPARHSVAGGARSSIQTFQCKRPP